jgi:hypothetical protein
MAESLYANIEEFPFCGDSQQRLRTHRVRDRAGSVPCQNRFALGSLLDDTSSYCVSIQL